MNPFFSIIIPVRHHTDYLTETLSHLKHQTFKRFEVLVITDKISKVPNPAIKRNIGAKKAQGKYLCFLDDDSYPDKNWLLNCYKLIQKHPKFAAFCGPAATPPGDNLYQQAGGLVWLSFLGSGGAGTYRSVPQSPRFVDDYPSVNLIVNKKDFFKVGGFDTYHWPGEDTVLCLNLTDKLRKKIYYHPSLLVFHHRRSILLPHLRQLGRYALHRGHFARIFPKTSFRLGYLIPSFFLIYLLGLPLELSLSPIFAIPLYIYIFLLLSELVRLSLLKNFKTSLLAIASIPPTHLYYGLLFIIGFFRPTLSFHPHHIDNQGNYLGG